MKKQPTNIRVDFEQFRNENKITYWWASEFMLMLGYKTMKSFEKVIQRAIAACMTLDIPFDTNFIVTMRKQDGKEVRDYKLTRFACYLTAMNGDPKKPEVAQAQFYFSQQTRRFELYLQGAEDIERVLVRKEIKEGNKALASTAKRAGVSNYSNFTNAGYLGMYNSSLWFLRNRRKLDPKEDIYDYMGRTELAANLFRITQTEERLKRRGVLGQEYSELTHRSVGRQVRHLVKQNTGRYPEQLRASRKLMEVKRELVTGAKKLNKMDKKDQ